MHLLDILCVVADNVQSILCFDHSSRLDIDVFNLLIVKPLWLLFLNIHHLVNFKVIYVNGWFQNGRQSEFYVTGLIWLMAIEIFINLRKVNRPPVIFESRSRNKGLIECVSTSALLRIIQRLFNSWISCNLMILLTINILNFLNFKFVL